MKAKPNHTAKKIRTTHEPRSPVPSATPTMVSMTDANMATMTTVGSRMPPQSIRPITAMDRTTLRML